MTVDLRTIAPLFLVALTAGFAFRQICLLTRWKSSRSEGQRLLFESALYGILLTLFSGIMWVIAPHATPSPFIYQMLADIPPVPGLPLFIGALIWGLVLPFLFNLLLRKEWAAKRIIRKYGTGLENLRLESIETKLPILLTLGTGKVYVGLCLDTPDPEQDNEYLRILPLLSGFRKEGTYQVVFNTSYGNVYQKIKEKTLPKIRGRKLKAIDFQVVIRTEEIKHASLYSNLKHTGIFEIKKKENVND